MTTASRQEKIWWRIFEFGLGVKGIKGIAELLGGVSILFIDQAALYGWMAHISAVSKGSIIDTLQTWVFDYLEKLSSHTIPFIAGYLIVHGVIHLVVIINIYRNKLWAYIVMLCATCGFAIYQIYRSIKGNTLLLIPVIIFDFGFMFLTLHEYEIHKKTLTQ